MYRPRLFRAHVDRTVPFPMCREQTASVSTKAGPYIREFLLQAVCNVRPVETDDEEIIAGSLFARLCLRDGQDCSRPCADEVRLRGVENAGQICQRLLGVVI